MFNYWTTWYSDGCKLIRWVENFKGYSPNYSPISPKKWCFSRWVMKKQKPEIIWFTGFWHFLAHFPAVREGFEPIQLVRCLSIFYEISKNYCHDFAMTLKIHVKQRTDNVLSITYLSSVINCPGLHPKLPVTVFRFLRLKIRKSHLIPKSCCKQGF